MSKESKPRDLRRHLGQTDYHGVCNSCGYYFSVHGRHRVDCVWSQPVQVSPAAALATVINVLGIERIISDKVR